MSGGFEDDIEEMPDPTSGSTTSTSGSASSSTTLPTGCVPEDFVSLAPSRCCV